MRVHTCTTWDIETGAVLRDSWFEYDGPVALCDRSIQSQAEGAAKTAGTTASGYGANAAAIGGPLTQQLQQEAANPIGFTPTQTNSMLVASEQGAGGATSGITGQAGLNAMRTRNSAALSGVLDQAARSRAQALSQGALSIQNKSAELGQQKQMEAQRALQGLYGTDVSAQLKGMGLQDQDLSTAIQAGNSGWLQNTDATITALSGAASKGAGIAGGYQG